MSAIQLNQANLSAIANQIPCPTYNRVDIKSGIVHIGVGGFHRAHQAYYINELLEKYRVVDWGICGVGIREGDRKMFDVLTQQDGMYTLCVQHPGGQIKSEAIGSITEMLLAVDTPELVINKMADPDTKIVSLTITEGGYNFHPQTGVFDFSNADIIHDLNNPNNPKTVFGYLAAALKKRKESGVQSFTVLSCDNIPHNGEVARKMLLTFVQKQHTELAQWIQENVTFPNTMVDRITPVTSKADIDHLENIHEIKDSWPVVCEPFIQWVVEDKFCNGRPALEKLGVQFVPDVVPYEKMKIRLLNAGHSVLGIPGALHGHATINDCMADPVFATFMRSFMDKEATPVLDVVEGINLDTYKDTLEERFSNPNIKDSVSRICSESSAKLPKFLIPTIHDNLQSGGSIKYATLLLAVWCYYSDKQVSEKNIPIDIIDAKKEELHRAASTTANNPVGFLALTEVFGDLQTKDRFVQEFRNMISLVYERQDIRSIMKDF